MPQLEAGETSEVRGPKLAFNLAPENSARMIKRAKRLLIIVGGGAEEMKSDGVNIFNVVSRISKSMNGTIVSSPGVAKGFAEKKDLNMINMSIGDTVNRLQNKDWNGFDGKGAYDMIVFIGGIYYYQSMMLSTLKHFNPKLKTISIDRLYHPNAAFSLENLTTEKWKDGLEGMLKVLEAK